MEKIKTLDERIDEMWYVEEPQAIRDLFIEYTQDLIKSLEETEESTAGSGHGVYGSGKVAGLRISQVVIKDRAKKWGIDCG